MKFGVHLPLIDFGDGSYAAEHLVEYVETAVGLGYEAVCANDHLVFGAPWLDGLTALAAVVSCSGTARLMTTTANPVVRGPAALAKALTALDAMSGGRVVAGVSPGSSQADYTLAGVPFEERWARFDEAVRSTRALLDGTGFAGSHYRVDESLAPRSARTGSPPLWIGSWGSDAGMRRVARLADGWLASAYNIAPDEFATRWAALQGRVATLARDPQSIGNGLATTWFHLDRPGDRHPADAVLTDRLAPVVHRPVEQLRQRLPFGGGAAALDLVGSFRNAGVQWLLVWPVGDGAADDIEQLHRFHDEVMVPLRS
ncbi:MAG TPA: LLM class flavin-dependent oxidoreductase [Lapillicoccus sp.]|nr:LLM class flavin-dependent oxidoreductase [Lapillicoccus sp.]